MANKQTRLEVELNDLFIKSTPALPNRVKRLLIQWAPIISVAIGFLTLLSAWSLWHWARVADTVISYANTVCNGYSGYSCSIPASHFSLWLWLGIIFLAIEGVLYLLAYPGLKNHNKEGWNYLYYGAILNLAYCLVDLFSSYDAISHFIGALLGSVVGFYLLFQIREAYMGKKRIAPTEAEPKENR